MEVFNTTFPAWQRFNLSIYLKSNWLFHSLIQDEIYWLKMGHSVSFFALTLGTNQCSLINNWVPHHSSVFSFQNLLNCDSTDAFRADSAVAPGLSAGLIQSAVELLWACFLLPCLSTLQYNRRWYSLCLCVRATLLFHEVIECGLLWSYPAAFSRNVSLSSIFQLIEEPS